MQNQKSRQDSAIENEASSSNSGEAPEQELSVGFALVGKINA